jgi:hypothetical protein
VTGSLRVSRETPLLFLSFAFFDPRYAEGLSPGAASLRSLRSSEIEFLILAD